MKNMANNMPTDKELQEKALYDIVQYLPLDEMKLKNYDEINEIVMYAKDLEKELGGIKGKLSKEDKSRKKAIEENLPAIEAILKDRPELGKAKISNMSWQDNNDESYRSYTTNRREYKEYYKEIHRNGLCFSMGKSNERYRRKNIRYK